MTQTPLVVGVFQQEAEAKAAIDALRSAGFGYDQVGVATRESGTTKNLAEDLTGLGMPRDQASYYDGEFNSGRTVVSVRPDGRDEEVMNILRNNNAYDYSSRDASTTAAGTSSRTYNQTDDRYSQQNITDTTTNDVGYARRGDYVQTGTANTATTADDVNETDEQRGLRLREERLNVDKERVQAGEVQLHKDVVEQQQNISVPVTHEEVVIERHPVSGEQVDNAPIGQDESIRIPVTDERVDVSKDTVVTGEVALGKRAIQENQQVSDTVRREEARLERSGDVNVRGEETLNNPNNPNRDNY